MGRKGLSFSFSVPIVLAIAGLALCLALVPGPGRCAGPVALDPAYKLEVLVPGCQFHGIHGNTFDAQDNFYVGSIMGLAIYKIDLSSGRVESFVKPPLGMCDDLEFGPDGSLYFTAPFMGKFFRRTPDGQVLELASGLPSINSVAVNKQGRVFGAQVNPKQDFLWEFDPSGKDKPRKVAEQVGGLNGFDFGPDGLIYGPQMFKGSVCRIDIATGKVETIAQGFDLPVALNFDARANCYLLTGGGHLYQLDIATGKNREIVKLPGGTDNISLDSKGSLYVTNMADNGIYRVDPKTGQVQTIMEGRLGVPQGISVLSGPQGDEVFLADIFSYRRINGQSGKVTTIGRPHGTALAILWPTCAAADGDKVLLSSQLTGTVQVVDRRTNQAKGVFPGFKAPSRAIALDDKFFLVSELASGKLIKAAFDDDKNRTVVADKLAGPACITQAGPGAVYVSEAAKGTISRVELASGARRVITDRLKVPVGLDLLSNGDIVVVDVAAKTLVRVHPADGKLTTLASGLPVGLFVDPAKGKPNLLTGVAVGSGDSIYVTGDEDNSLIKLSRKQ